MTELGIPWRVLFQVGGKFNWVRSVGTSLISVAIFHAVSTWRMEGRRDHHVRAVAAQREAIERGGEGLKPGESRVVPIEYAQRPEAFAKSFDDRIRYRKLWSAAFGLLGIVLFFMGSGIELVGEDVETKG